MARHGEASNRMVLPVIVKRSAARRSEALLAMATVGKARQSYAKCSLYWRGRARPG